MLNTGQSFRFSFLVTQSIALINFPDSQMQNAITAVPAITANMVVAKILLIYAASLVFSFIPP